MNGKVRRYDDEVGFLESMINHIRNNYDIDDEDRVDLADYLFEMSNSNSRELRSRLTQLICHMLKLQYQPQRATSSWLKSITNQTIEISQLVKNSPSLKPRLCDTLPDIYKDGLDLAKTETKLDDSIFPKQCPWTFDQLLNKDYVLSYMKEYEQKITNPYYSKSSS